LNASPGNGPNGWRGSGNYWTAANKSCSLPRSRAPRIICATLTGSRRICRVPERRALFRAFPLLHRLGIGEGQHVRTGQSWRAAPALPAAAVHRVRQWRA
jgi:hypothetical protein